MRGADLLVASLKAAGVTKIFSLSGNQIMPVYDACFEQDVDIVHVRHESAAVFMAEAWAQLTGGLGVALVTAAPGFANALGALYTAKGSESPVLLLAGDSPVGMDGKGAFQELDQVAMASPLTKLSQRPRSADALADAVAAASRTARAWRPGPVHIALPFDVLNASTEASPPPPEDCLPEPATAEASDLAGLIAGSARPLIVTGPALNLSRTGDLHDRLEAATDAPVLALESPRGLGDPAMGDLKSLMAESDLVVSLGKRIDFTLGFGDGATAWAVVDSEETAMAAARANLGDALVHATSADPLAMAEALSQGAHPARADWTARAAALLARRPAASTGPGISSAAVAAAVERRLKAAGSAVACLDGGEFGQWAQAGVSTGQRLINGPAGAIGGGLCYGIAAKLARPDAAVYAMMGDGSAGFHFSEFETAARAGANFVAVIGADGVWNAEHQIQLRDYGANRLIGCDLSDARYDQAVAALGGHAEYVEHEADLDAALERAENSGKPACVVVKIIGEAAPSPGAH